MLNFQFLLNKGYSREQLGKLTKLDLRNIQIDQIDVNLFETCSNLNYLSLSNNRLINLDANTFKKLTELTELDVSNNQISTIGAKAFETYWNFEKLRLGNNKLTKIDGNTFKNNANLKELDLSFNKIESIEVILFGTCFNLNQLYLNNNRLTKIDAGTFNQLTELTELDLSNNEIVSIDVNLFESCLNLTELYLNNNNLTKIYVNTFKLTNLTRLDLSNNQIESIDERLFETCLNLTLLDLGSNKLARIDGNTFKQLNKLNKLWLYGNQIEAFEAKLFATLSNLFKLYLNFNKLTRLDANSFEQVNKLTELHLSNNQIERIDSKAFKNCSSLRQVYISNNKLTRLDAYTFSDVTNLTRLDLSCNRIETIDVNLFKTCSYLTELYLHDNKLENIHRGAFETLTSIQIVSIYNNQVKCLSFYDGKFDLKWSFIENLEKNIKEKGYFSDFKQFLDQLEILEINNLQYKQNVSKDDSASNIVRFVYDYDRYKQIKLLGIGSFGYVHLVVDTKLRLKDEEAYKAMKVMNKLDPTAENEFSLMWKINHENIVKYYEHFDHEIDAFDYTCVITEYCQKGDFSKIISRARRDRTSFKETEILDWMIQATNGLKYLHEKCKIVHRDIKPANILLTKDNIVKLADFGVAKSLLNSTVRQSLVGTPAYMSPEQSQGSLYNEQPEQDYSTYKAKTDIWSLGCVLYELIHLVFAFPRGLDSDDTLIPNLEDSGRFSDLLKKMLVKNASQRINSKSLYSALVALEENIT